MRRRGAARSGAGCCRVGAVTRWSTVRPAGLSVGRAVELPNLDELQAEPLHALEQPVQRVLIVDRAAEDRLRRLHLGIESLEPRRELLPDSSLDANLVTLRHCCSSL